MPQLLYKSTAVPGVPPTGILDVEFSELIWAAFTVGRWRDDLYLGPAYWPYELISRFGLIRAYLGLDGHDNFVRTAAYDRLDPTEKSGVSYHLGMAVAKILSERLLNTPWLMHIDRYRQIYGVTLKQGLGRPDLFGPRDVQTMTDWVVIEAKGRTNAARQADVQKMIDQKALVVTIGGAVPWVRGGVAAHFPRGQLEAEFVDPSARPEDERVEAFEDYVPEPSTFARAYYEPVLDVLGAGSQDAPEGVQPPSVRRLPEVDVAVGLIQPPSIIARPSEPLAVEPVREPLVHVGSDGVIVRLGSSWSPDNMRRELGERDRHEF
jgi:hypothetical protein